MARLDLRLSLLERQADQAARRATRQLGTAIRDGFSDPSYAWPGVTKRRNGSTAGTVRDVLDTGALRDSQTAPQRLGSGHYQLAWTADHAAATFLGAVFKRRRGSLPARNVPMNVLRDFPFAQAFADGWA